MLRGPFWVAFNNKIIIIMRFVKRFLPSTQSAERKRKGKRIRGKEKDET